MKRRMTKVLLLVLCFLVLGGSYVLADSLAAGKAEFFYSAQECMEAATTLNAAGHPTMIWAGYPYQTADQFTEANLTSHPQDAVKYKDFLYISSHGTTNTYTAFMDNPGAWVYSYEVKSWAPGWFKFVFMNACYSANKSDMSEAFGIPATDDG